MRRDILIGIAIGAAICAPCIAFGPALAPEAAAAPLFAGGLGALALLTAASRHHPAAVGIGGAGLLLIGGYALAAGILVGPAALLAAVLMTGAGILLGARVLRSGASGWRRPGGDPA